MADLKRHERVALVRSALVRDEYKTTAEIANEVDLSPQLTYSTLRLISEVTRNEALTFAPNHGWKLAESWDEKRGYVAWLHKHVSTRVDTLRRHVDVARGLWGDQVPRLLVSALRWASEALDLADEEIAVEVVEQPVRPRQNRAEVIR